MRKSRIVLAGVAVATAAAGTAFTNTNTVPASVAGYGTAGVSGIVVNNIAYTPLASEPAKLANITFTAAADVTGDATLTLRNGSTIVLNGIYACEAVDPAAPRQIVCNTTNNPDFTSFTDIGLTVAQ